MAKKQMLFKTKGMNRDLSVSAFNPEFAFENMNLRLSTNEGNTMMSWVNERGTSQISIVSENSSPANIVGVPIGTAILNHKLVVFTTEGEDNSDHIYVLEYNNDDKTQMLVTKKYSGNIKLDEKHPLETLVSYESEKIQKIYWVDGKNQPRVINIASENIVDKPTTFFDFIPTLQLQEEVTVKKILGGNGTFAPGVIQYAFTYYNKYGQESNIFYTTPLYYLSHKDRGASPEDKVDNAFEITIKNVDKNFDYLRVYSIQRTSVNGTPICKRVQDIFLEEYLNNISEKEYAYANTSPVVVKNGSAIGPTVPVEDRLLFGSSVPCIGYSKDNIEIIADNNTVTFGGTSTNSSIIWITVNKITHNNTTAFFIVESPDSTNSGITEPLSVQGKPLTFIDNGTSGDSIDPTELLYKGGEAIIANTIEQKDGTLFLGNFKSNRKSLNDLKNTIISTLEVASEDSNNQPYYREIYANKVSEGDYYYASQLTAFEDGNNKKSTPCGGFKKGDYYRCGVQFQHKTGKWSEPIFVGDIEVKGAPSVDVNNKAKIHLPVLKGHITNESGVEVGTSTIEKLISEGYRKVRPVVVFPEMKDRVTLCQGVASPTVYTDNHRGIEANNTADLYAQSSWFFRTRYQDSQIASDGTVLPFYGTKPSNTLPYTYAGDESHNYNPDNIRGVEIQGDFLPENRFKVDNNFVTFHSPDIEFDMQLWNTSFENVKGYRVGDALISKTWADISIQTESPTISNKGNGFVKKAFSKGNAYGIVSGLFYEDFIVDDAGDDDKNLYAWEKEKSAYKWMVYTWNKDGSLNNDINRPSDRGTPTAILKKKVISNLRITGTDWAKKENVIDFDFLGNPELFSSEEATIIKVNSNVYEGNIDTMLSPDTSDGMYFAFPYEVGGTAPIIIYPDPKAEVSEVPFNLDICWRTSAKENGSDHGIQYWDYFTDPNNKIWKLANGDVGTSYVDLVMKKSGVRMKYKSTPHVVFQKQEDVNKNLFPNNYTLPIVEIRRTIDKATIFGGTSTDALKENNWVPCGEPVAICDSQLAPINDIEFEYSYGDTYFQRWDCLKTYAFTKEDTNQVVEIGSFMLESRINCDGRYDRNRGQVNNTNMSPQNFNLLNPVYSQIDNFFSYKILDDSYYENTNYLNQITWSKTKEAGADVDLWTNMTLASVLELDGDKGELNKLIRFNNYLFAFQDRGISQILYNDNVQIQSTQGVPIEIANSGKVSGKDYKSSSIGCSNKWSMVTTPNGIYFMDSNDKSIYLFNGQLTNISNLGGFNSWCKQNIPSANAKWTPIPYEENEQGVNIGGFENFVGYYDKLNQDVLYINKNTALAWSEKLQAFTSFYDYGNTPFFVTLDDTGIWINKDLVNQSWHLWRHQAGNYCKFFGKNRPYWMTLVGNPEPQLDKVFTNLEFRATQTMNDPGDLGLVPFNYIETWNDYQHGKANIDIRNGHDLFKHHPITDGNYDASLIKKFRIWRCDIPRDNAPLNFVEDLKMGISRTGRHPMDRMRNPWLYIKLYHGEAETRYFLRKTEIHDIVMTYFD